MRHGERPRVQGAECVIDFSAPIGRLRPTPATTIRNERRRPQVPSAAAGVRPADRLGFTLFIAAILHVAFILGVGFSMPAPSQISKTLEITLATFKSDKAPEKADYLAQMNQQGSGTLEHKAAPKTTEVAPFQDNQVKKVAPPATPKQARSEEAPRPR